MTHFDNFVNASIQSTLKGYRGTIAIVRLVRCNTVGGATERDRTSEPPRRSVRFCGRSRNDVISERPRLRKRTRGKLELAREFCAVRARGASRAATNRKRRTRPGVSRLARVHAVSPAASQVDKKATDISRLGGVQGAAVIKTASPTYGIQRETMRTKRAYATYTRRRRSPPSPAFLLLLLLLRRIESGIRTQTRFSTSRSQFALHFQSALLLGGGRDKHCRGIGQTRRDNGPRCFPRTETLLRRFLSRRRKGRRARVRRSQARLLEKERKEEREEGRRERIARRERGILTR